MNCLHLKRAPDALSWLLTPHVRRQILDEIRLPMRTALKVLANSLCWWAVLPHVVVFRLAALLLGKEKAFAGLSERISRWPGVAGAYLRHAVMRHVLDSCGENLVLGFGVLLSSSRTTFGRGVYIGSYTCLGEATLEDDVLIGSMVSIMNGGRQHGIERLDIPVRDQPGEWPRITIGADTWIGDQAIVMANIGRHCVIGAGTVVNRPVPDYAIVVGNPGREIRFRNESGASPNEPDRLQSMDGEGIR